jgi:hypothetical protein
LKASPIAIFKPYFPDSKQYQDNAVLQRKTIFYSLWVHNQQKIIQHLPQWAFLWDYWHASHSENKTTIYTSANTNKPGKSSTDI